MNAADAHGVRSRPRGLAAAACTILALASCGGESARDQALEGLERASQAAGLEAEMAGLVAELPDGSDAAAAEQLQASVDELDSEAEELLASADSGEAYDEKISAAVEETRGAGTELASAAEKPSTAGEAQAKAVRRLQASNENLTGATELIGTELQDEQGNLSAEDAAALEQTLADVEESGKAVSGAAGLTVERLLNLAIPVETCDLPTVPWQNGIHPDSGSPISGGFGAQYVVEVVGAEGGTTAAGGTELQAVVGDVTGDGAAEGVVTTTESCGGNTSFGGTYVFGPDGKLITRLPDTVNEPGATFPETHTNLSIVDGGIEMDVRGFTASDSHVTGGSLQEHVRFEWNGSDFERVN